MGDKKPQTPATPPPGKTPKKMPPPSPVPNRSKPGKTR